MSYRQLIFLASSGFSVGAHKRSPMEKETRKAGSETDAIAIVEHLLAGGEVLPEQSVVQSRWSQEKELAAAVLLDALTEVRDYHRDPSYKRKVSEDLQWIFSDDAEWPFSFVNLCALFGLEPACVRRIVWGWLIGPAAHSQRQFGRHRLVA